MREREEFLEYYNRELSYLRQAGAEFGRKHAVASRLRLEADHCDDPHVERLLEAFAFIAARIHLRLDDEFPEITGLLLEELYPNFTRPVPSVSLVEFQLDPDQGQTTVGRHIPRGTPIQSRPSGGFVCRFRTCYDVELLPLEVKGGSWRPGTGLPVTPARPTAAAVEIRVSCFPTVSFSGLPLSRLRFHLNGLSDVTYPLYELLLSRCHTILLQNPATGAVVAQLSGTSVAAAGFDPEDALFTDSRQRRGFAGYQALEDYCVFPEKFLFFDVTGLEAVRHAGLNQDLSIMFLLSPFERADWKAVLEQGVAADTFRLNCSPIVNLFPATSDPVPIRRTVYELPVPAPARMEIYSIDQLTGAGASGKLERYIDCASGRTRTDVAGYWSAMRRPSRLKEGASELFVSILDRHGVPAETGASSLTARLTCTNGDLPFRLPVGNPHGDFQMEDHPEVQKILCLHRPTQGHPAPSASTGLWRLVSQLSLNHLSLAAEGGAALQTILRIHNFTDSDHAGQNIDGIVGLASRPHFARVSTEHGIAFVRGKLVELTLNEERFTGRGAFLFAAIIERFLGLYTSLNSFSQLALRSSQRGEKIVYTWPPRAGAKVVV